MQIIDKNKDYYDYCQFEFGPVDKTATYDRRQSVIVTRENFYNYCYASQTSKNHWFERRTSYYILLEIGNIQYVLEFNNVDVKLINRETGEYSVKGDITVFNKFEENVHLCPKPVTLTHFDNRNRFNWKSGNTGIRSVNDIKIKNDHLKFAFENPILKDTPVPSIIPARDFYNTLDNYFRSFQNDKTVEIVNSDIDKAVNHGFDKKTSFRHPVK